MGALTHSILSYPIPSHRRMISSGTSVLYDTWCACGWLVGIFWGSTAIIIRLCSCASLVAFIIQIFGTTPPTFTTCKGTPSPGTSPKLYLYLYATHRSCVCASDSCTRKKTQDKWVGWCGVVWCARKTGERGEKGGGRHGASNGPLAFAYHQLPLLILHPPRSNCDRAFLAYNTRLIYRRTTHTHTLVHEG